MNKQKELRERREDNPVVLAELASARSSKSSEKARVRASMARAA